MKITALVENVSEGEFKAKHGLALYIETQKHKILFDLGPDETLFDHAEKKGIHLEEVDLVILSHGHVDHGGALKKFLDKNETAKIYVQQSAFEPHYSKIGFLKIPVGISEKLQLHPQVVLVEGDVAIDEELLLFTVEKQKKCRSPVNEVLYEKGRKDNFIHEQNLMIFAGKNVLIMGCGHAGIVNIMEKAKKYHPSVCIGGYHLWNPMSKKTVSDGLLEEIADELKQYPDTQFWTCHCTEQKAYQYLKTRLPDMKYLSCGMEIKV